jgi:3-deoxy-D-manno-octulosonic-acid transferase
MRSPAAGASRLLYTLGWLCALPAVAAYLLLRSLRQPEYRRFWGERFLGHAAAAPSPGAGPTIWVHAVSVGETRAAQPLIERLARDYPSARFVLTHMTPTGRAAAVPLIRALQGRAVQRYLPYDLPCVVRRFLREVRPALGVLMETEIWPNLQRHARRTGLPVMLANARLSERSLRRAQRWPALMRPAAACLAAVAAQSPDDAARWSRLYEGPISVTGNLKFDASPPPGLLDQGRGRRQRLGGRPLWIFASTREGEERLIVEALQRMGAVPGCLGEPAPVLLFVPRHPQRFEEVGALLAALGRPVIRRAEFDALSPQADVLLGDSMGEMPMYYAMADLALIGGSLLPLGGQNLIEACACGCPVLFGPHMFNFSQAAGDALRAGAAEQVTDVDSALRSMRALQADGARRQGMARAASVFAGAHRGATDRTAELIAGAMRLTAAAAR